MARTKSHWIRANKAHAVSRPDSTTSFIPSQGAPTITHPSTLRATTPCPCETPSDGGGMPVDQRLYDAPCLRRCRRRLGSRSVSRPSTGEALLRECRTPTSRTDRTRSISLSASPRLGGVTRMLQDAMIGAPTAQCNGCCGWTPWIVDGGQAQAELPAGPVQIRRVCLGCRRHDLELFEPPREECGGGRRTKGSRVAADQELPLDAWSTPCAVPP